MRVRKDDERMEILLGDNLRITSDSKNYVLEKRILSKIGKNAGEYVWNQEGYYGTIQSLLRSLVDVTLRESESKSKPTWCSLLR